MMTKTKTLLFSTACAALMAGPALAQEATEVDELVVAANRSARQPDRIGEAVTVLNKDTIRASQVVVVSDLLSQTPGVAFSRNGGVGGTTSLRIRGAEADQTAVVLDGVKLADAAAPGGGFNFANLLVGDIARIEVLRGAQSTLWGSQAIGGVVHLTTAEPTEPFEVSLDAEGGEMRTAYARAALGGAGEQVTWRLSAARLLTDGVSAFRTGAEADGYRNTGLSGRLTIKASEDLSFDLRGSKTHARNETDGFPPPFYAFADSPEYGVSDEASGYAGANLALLDGRLDNRLGYSVSRTDRDLLDPTQAVTPVTFYSKGETRRWEYQGVLEVNADWAATFGAEREDSRMRTASPSAFAPTPPPTLGKVGTDSFYVQAQGTVASGLTLTGGLRRDDHETFGGRTLGQASAAWSLNAGKTVLRASFGQGFKAPTLYQLYSEYGNTALDPEEADGWDAGVEHTLLEGTLKVSATYFSRETTNQIDFVSCIFGSTDPLCSVGGIPRFGYYDNIARAKAEGVEVAAAARLGGVSVQANYTWTEAKNDAPTSVNFGRLLARRPEQQANLWATYVWPIGLSTTAAVRYVGDSFNNAANTDTLKAYTLIDLRASYPVTDAVEVYGRVENLTDEDYQTTRGYGSTGRAAYIGVRGRF